MNKTRLDRAAGKERREQVTLKRTGKRPLSFTGEQLASYLTSMNNAHADYSGELGIHHKAAVYRTDTNMYVLEFVTYSAWQGSTDNYQGHASDGIENILDVIEAELPERLATPLLAELSEHVDIAEKL